LSNDAEGVEVLASNQLIDNRYKIHDLIGRGGMGEVYRATDTQTGQTVAVKALDPDIVSRDPDLLERFRREGEALRQLNHPNIVRMVTALEEGERHYLVMEYVSGGCLEGVLEQQGRLPSKRVVDIALEVVDALTRAHHLGIIHRDLKPANVLLADDGTPRLADFGIAYVSDIPRVTQTGALVGTVDYLRPEV
jgi:serine/threonine protein kinase